MPTTQRRPAVPRAHRRGEGTHRTRPDTARARLLRVLLAHRALVAALVHGHAGHGVDDAASDTVGEATGASRAWAVRGGDPVLHAALRASSGVLVASSRGGLPVPADPDRGGWAVVHAVAPETRRTLRRRWFPWTLRAWLPTPRDGALAVLSWGAPARAGRA